MMNNLNFQKLNKIISRKMKKTIIVSFLTTTATMCIFSTLVFFNRAAIARVLGFVSPIQVSPISLINKNIDLKNNLLGDTALSVLKEDSVVGVVKAANPAVVSIVETKEVPKYDVTYNNNNPFGDVFGSIPGFSFNTPSYTQNGTEKKEVGSGSGFIISADGYIVTNRHVVPDTDASYTVTLNNTKKYTAKVLARDSVLDVAILKIDSTSSNFPYLALGDSSAIDVGQSVVAIGNALGQFKNTVSTGVVSGLSRSITAGDSMGNAEKLDKVIQTDAAINPGNSGGPLLDMYAHVIGVNVAVVSGSENIGFALPINSIKSVINSVKKTGKITRPYVGIRYVVVDANLKAKNNLTVDYGILVAKGKDASELAVIPGSPADKAGIVENDIILEVDGQKIDSEHDFAYYIRGKNIGDNVSLRVLSKGTEKTLYMNLAQAPEIK